MTFCKNELMEQNNELLRQSVDRVYVCSGDPQTFVEATAQKLGEASINYFSFTGPFVFVGLGGETGRKVILNAFSATISISGMGQVLAFVNTSTQVLWRTISRTFPKDLISGETVNVSATELVEGFPEKII